MALLGVSEKDRKLLVDELKQFGSILRQGGDAQRYEVELLTAEDAGDIEAVMCFIAEPEQLEICVLGIAAPTVIRGFSEP